MNYLGLIRKAVPRNNILYFSYSCHSRFFVESKSLKLYLFSLNNKKFSSTEDLSSNHKKRFGDYFENRNFNRGL